MSLVRLLAVGVSVAGASILGAGAEAATLRVSGDVADGGSFSGWFEVDAAAQDVCPAVGVGCFDAPSGKVEGVGPRGAYVAPSSDFFSEPIKVSILAATSEINFVFSGRWEPDSSGMRYEMGLVARYAYLDSRPADLGWNGDVSALGAFLGGTFSDEFGYESAVTRFDVAVAPVPVPPALPLLGAGVLGLLALRRPRGRAA